MSIITGEILRIARIIYGYESQESLGEELGVSLGTIQRYEASDIVEPKILGIYEHQLHFNLTSIAEVIGRARRERNLKVATYKGMHPAKNLSLK